MSWALSLGFSAQFFDCTHRGCCASEGEGIARKAVLPVLPKPTAKSGMTYREGVITLVGRLSLTYSWALHDAKKIYVVCATPGCNALVSMVALWRQAALLTCT